MVFKSQRHDFQPPSPNDIRGPCSGLNRAANHDYIDRSGITTFEELIQMQMELYNFDLLLSTVLTIVGVALDGNILTDQLSIERKSSSVSGILNTPSGLNQHNTFEGDTK